LFNTGRVGCGDLVQNRSGMRGAIAAVVRVMGTIVLDVILPVRVNDNGSRRVMNRRTIHAQRMEMIKLLAFTLFPFRPGGKFVKLAVGEMTKRLLCGSNSMGLNGVDCHGELISRDGRFREVQVGVLNRSDGANVGDRENRDVVGIGSVGIEQVMFGKGLPELGRGQATFWSKFQGDGGVSGIIDRAKSRSSIVEGEDGMAIDGDKVGAAELVASGLVGRVKAGSTGILTEVLDVDAVADFIGSKGETKRRILAVNEHLFGNRMGKRSSAEGELGDGGVSWFRR